MIPVYWLAPGDQWDQTMLRDLLDGKLWRPAGYPEFVHQPLVNDLDLLRVQSELVVMGGVVVIPGRYYADAASVADLQEILASWAWVVVFVTSDEERLFPFEALQGAGRVVWLQTPQEADTAATRVFGHGYTPGTRERALEDKVLPWFFAGQITHSRRKELAEALMALPEQEALFHPTTGFNTGIDHDEYLRLMSMAKVVPCPSGPVTVDSFRFWEALELGCVPIADVRTPTRDMANYWDDIFEIAPGLPFCTTDDWTDVGSAGIDPELSTWPDAANEIGAWYMAYKRAMAETFHADLVEVSGTREALGVRNDQYEDRVTVLISTSPSVHHPSTEQLATVIESVRFHFPTAPIIVSCDGVAPELEHRRAGYEEYLRRVVWACHHDWVNVQPVIHSEHLHQAGCAADAIDNYVRTPQILFMEHDTPLVTDEPIDWWLLSHAIADGRLNMVRFHYEAHIPEPHRHLMIDNPDLPGHSYRGVPVVRTMQWSQRPHLARTVWYQNLLHRYFGPEACTMIEDVMHGVVDYALRTRGAKAWDQWKIGIYAPEGPNWKRSLNLDGRGDDPKPEMRFAYDGETPEGAPAPTAGRVD